MGESGLEVFFFLLNRAMEGSRSRVLMTRVDMCKILVQNVWARGQLQQMGRCVPRSVQPQTIKGVG